MKNEKETLIFAEASRNGHEGRKGLKTRKFFADLAAYASRENFHEIALTVTFVGSHPAQFTHFLCIGE